MDLHGNSTFFSWLGGDGDKLTGNVTWTVVANGSANPHFNATLSGVVATGDAAFTNAFPGSSAMLDLILGAISCQNSGTVVAPTTPCTLENLFTDTNVIAFAPVSGGQLTQVK